MAYDSDGGRSEISVNSTDTLPEEDTFNINKLKNSIELYKKKLYNRVIPNDENGISQTDVSEKNWKAIQANDANILLSEEDTCDIDGLSEEANEYLKSFFCGNMNTNESINFTSIIRISLIDFPNNIKVDHAIKLIKTLI